MLKIKHHRQRYHHLTTFRHHQSLRRRRHRTMGRLKSHRQRPTKLLPPPTIRRHRHEATLITPTEVIN